MNFETRNLAAEGQEPHPSQNLRRVRHPQKRDLHSGDTPGCPTRPNCGSTSSSSGGGISNLTPDGNGGALILYDDTGNNNQPTMMMTSTGATYQAPLAYSNWVLGENGNAFITDGTSVVAFNPSSGQSQWTYAPAQGAVNSLHAAEGGGVTIIDGSLNQIPLDATGAPGAVVGGVASTSPTAMSNWLSVSNGGPSVLTGSPFRSASSEWTTFEGSEKNQNSTPKLVTATFEARVPGQPGAGNPMGTTVVSQFESRD